MEVTTWEKARRQTLQVVQAVIDVNIPGLSIASLAEDNLIKAPIGVHITGRHGGLLMASTECSAPEGHGKQHCQCRSYGLAVLALIMTPKLPNLTGGCHAVHSYAQRLVRRVHAVSTIAKACR